MKFKTIKMVAVCMISIFLLNVSVAMAAAPNNIKDENYLKPEQVINEYDRYKELKSLSESDLVNEGYAEKDVEIIKNFDYEKEMQKHVESIQQLDDLTLTEMGYSNEQISIIRNFSGSEEEIQALAATLTISIQQVSSSKSNSYSQITFKVIWNWSSQPINRFTDIIGIGCSESMLLDTGASSASLTYKFGSATSNGTASVTSNAAAGSARVNIPMSGPVLYDPSSGINGYSVCMGGTATAKFYKSSYINEVGTYTAYGHYQIVAIGSVSFTGVGFSFTGLCIEQDSDYKPFVLSPL